MADKEDKWNNYLMVYEPFQAQNFKRKDLSWNACKKYPNYHLGTFRTQNQYNYKTNKMRDIKSYSKNLMDLDRKKIKINSSNRSKKCHPWSDEAMEEERKRQLSDTANKLMNKLKMWNMGKNEKQIENGNSVSRSCIKETESINEKGEYGTTSLCNGRPINQKKGDVNNQESKKLEPLQEDASQKKTVLLKYDIKNSSQRTVKNDKEKKQKKIHQSLIGELMTMPKQNWKYVLSDPKMHPKIERKMTQIVKENRLLLAQKFRFLAESKINSQGQCAYTKFVDDLGDLIDSDLAVDLCQLPSEVIKQISDIFQLNIEGNLKETDFQENSSDDKNVDNIHFDTNCNELGENIDDNILSNECKSQESKNDEDFCVKNELKDISDPENSNVLKDSVNDNSSVEIFPNTYSGIYIKTEPVFSSGDCHSNCSDEGNISESYHAELEESCHSLPEQHNLNSGINVNDISLSGSEYFSLRDKVSLKEEIHSEEEIDICENKFNTERERNNSKEEPYDLLDLDSVTDSQRNDVTYSLNEKSETDIRKAKVKHFTTDDSDLENPVNNCHLILHTNERNFQDTIPNYVKDGDIKERHSTETQTDISVVESDYSETFKKEQGFKDKEALLKEVQMIDDLVHRLNQRRYVIFLSLVGLKSLDTSEHFLKTSLIEAVTNGDKELLKKLDDKNAVVECSSAIAWCSPKSNLGRTKRHESPKRGSKRRLQTKDLHSDRKRTRDWKPSKSIRSSSHFINELDPEK